MKPAAGLEAIDIILDRSDLRDYHLAYAAKADLCRRLGRTDEARAAYEQALSLAQQGPERRFLEKRLREVDLLGTADGNKQVMLPQKPRQLVKQFFAPVHT